MLEFLGNNEALTQLQIVQIRQKLRYSNKAVSNSNVAVTRPLLL